MVTTLAECSLGRLAVGGSSCLAQVAARARVRTRQRVAEQIADARRDKGNKEAGANAAGLLTGRVL